MMEEAKEFAGNNNEEKNHMVCVRGRNGSRIVKVIQRALWC